MGQLLLCVPSNETLAPTPAASEQVQSPEANPLSQTVPEDTLAPLTEQSEMERTPQGSLEAKMYPDLRNCPTVETKFRYSQTGNYWVLENFVQAAYEHRCDESITYATHGEYTFMDNLDPLSNRWQVCLEFMSYNIQC